MLNQEALLLAVQLIKEQMITLDDIPKEFANTIANIYYKYAVICIETTEAKGQPPKSIFQESGGNFRDKLDKYLKYCTSVKADFEAASKYVVILRDLKKANSIEYDGILNFALDTLKYNIKNAMYKPEIVRKMERPFKKADEIEGLINLMKF